MSTASYDASVALDRKLTAEETRELKISLMPYFHASGDNEASPEDINDLLDYAFAMVNNQKTVEYVIQELVGMEMEFCNSTVAGKVGAELSGFLKKAMGQVEEETGGKIASLKSASSEKGNALTMSGALGASRERKPKAEKGKTEKKQRDDNRRGDRNKGRGERDDRGGRGRGRSNHKEAFDRLANGGNSNNRRGRDSDRRRRDEDRRGGRGRGDGRRDGGRGRFGGRGDRASGSRRSRDEYEDKGNDSQDFVPMRDGRGRGRGGRGRGRGDGAPKRARYDDYHDEGYGDGGYYDEGYGHDDGYGYGGYHHGYGGRYGGFRGGRGRGRYGGRGRGRGRGRGPPAEGEAAETKGEGSASNETSDAAANHPSPLVQANYSGGRGYGGRGRFGRGRGGRGRGGGRAHVVSMIQSKTWVRKKPEDAAASESNPAPPAE